MEKFTAVLCGISMITVVVLGLMLGIAKKDLRESLERNQEIAGQLAEMENEKKALKEQYNTQFNSLLAKVEGYEAKYGNLLQSVKKALQVAIDERDEALSNGQSLASELKRVNKRAEDLRRMLEGWQDNAAELESEILELRVKYWDLLNEREMEAQAYAAEFPEVEEDNEPFYMKKSHARMDPWNDPLHISQSDKKEPSRGPEGDYILKVEDLGPVFRGSKEKEFRIEIERD